ncbi:MAG: ComEC/Rec2 family competence protein [Rhizobiales bacterium]|nr:ComEC/Rec2 family competence protein [Hyphomicrobiales bacterium]
MAGGGRRIDGRAAAAAAPAWAGLALGEAGALRAAFARWAEREVAHRRPFLWLPVVFGLGVLAYFGADREPALWAPATAALVFAGAALALRRRAASGPFLATLALAFLFAGFAAATLRTRLVAAPVLERLTIARVTAFVETVDDRGAGGRLLLRVVSIEGLDKAATPERLRVTTRTRPSVAAGATVVATMRLLPPSRASEPGGYDFSRDAFFAMIGGVGGVLGAIERAPDAEVSALARFNAWIDRARNALTDRIVDVVGGGLAPGDGAVAAALVTGKRGLIPESANASLRAAGIYHVVSISGLHMVLAAGLFLWLARGALATVPGLALTKPIKSWAALAAMAGAVAYDVFSGSEVATERSLIMTLVMLGAIVVGRRAISMRNLALAALIVLAREPETLLGPSFQMSFAAVAGLTAAFERGPGSERAAPDPDARFGLWGHRVRLVLWATVVSTLVASLATDPFSTFHFHRLTPYGLIGNALTLPLVEFVVMPAALIGVAASPFGLDAPVWTVMGWGVSGVMAVARFVEALPGSTVFTPAFGAGALLAMALAVIWWAIWITPIRWLAAPVFVAGALLAARAPKPDLVVDAQARAMAVRGADGRLQIVGGRANAFGAAQWLLADADGRDPRAPETMGGARCDAMGCVALLADGRAAALIHDRRALPEDCGRAAIVVTRLFTRGVCAGPDLVIDGAHLAERGATAARLAGGRVVVVADRPKGYDRPWAPAPKPRPAPPPTHAPELADPADPSLYAPD